MVLLHHWEMGKDPNEYSYTDTRKRLEEEQEFAGMSDERKRKYEKKQEKRRLKREREKRKEAGGSSQVPMVVSSQGPRAGSSQTARGGSSRTPATKHGNSQTPGSRATSWRNSTGMARSESGYESDGRLSPALDGEAGPSSQLPVRQLAPPVVGSSQMVSQVPGFGGAGSQAVGRSSQMMAPGMAGRKKRAKRMEGF